MSKSFFSVDSSIQTKKNIDAFFKFPHFVFVFSKSQNSKKLRKSLNVVLNEKIMTQVERELRRCKREKIDKIMYFMKKHYREILDKNVNFHKFAFNQRNEENAMKKDFKKIIRNLKIKNDYFQKNVEGNSKIISSTSIEKRLMKISNSFMFPNEKIMSIIQWIIKIKNKLYVNANQFDTKKFKIMYVLSRTEKLTTKHLNSRTRERIFCLVSFIRKHVDQFERNTWRFQ